MENNILFTKPGRLRGEHQYTITYSASDSLQALTIEGRDYPGAIYLDGTLGSGMAWPLHYAAQRLSAFGRPVVIRMPYGPDSEYSTAVYNPATALHNDCGIRADSLEQLVAVMRDAGLEWDMIRIDQAINRLTADRVGEAR